jgi:NAD(P)-dependent dehydrogenase (short-subunit alcohol dehydrogenase family)
MNNDFASKTVIITGATSGIGRATARLAYDRGANIVVTGRKDRELVETAKSFDAARVESVIADLTKEEDRRRVVDRAIARFTAIDVLVNAAGIIGNGTIENTTLEQWDRMMDVNLRSLFRMTQLALPSLITRKGNIVNISSVTGIRSFPNVMAYCVSKAGVDQLTHCAALELGARGVRVNAVDPGVVLTNLHRNSGMDEEAYKKFIDHSSTTHPIGRVGKPEEVAELILFLASDRAGWITGASYSIDGGRAQTCAR